MEPNDRGFSSEIGEKFDHSSAQTIDFHSEIGEKFDHGGARTIDFHSEIGGSSNTVHGGSFGVKDQKTVTGYSKMRVVPPPVASRNSFC